MPRPFRGWSVVGAVAIALSVSGTTFAAGTFGVLTAYLGRSYGWRQDQMAPGLSIFLLCATACVPLVGLLVDRFGSKRVALCGIVALAATLVAGTQITSIPSLYLFYAFVGFTGAFTNPIAYLRAISLWFDRNRGLALGLAVAGQGAGGALLPIFIDRMAESGGWQACLLILAAILILVMAPVVAVFVKDDPAQLGEVADGARASGAPVTPPDLESGVTLKEALGVRAFWIILVVLGLLGLTSYAVSANMVFLLTHSQGFSLRHAAELQGIGGISMLVGRVVFGWFMDRHHAPRVGAIGVLLLAVAAVLTPHLHSFGPLAIVWAVMLGLSGGAETDLLTLLVSRYFGRKSMSKIYSWHNVTFLVGAAAGPPLFASGVAVFGGPLPALVAVAGASLVAVAMLLSLGPYPVFERSEADFVEETVEVAI